MTGLKKAAPHRGANLPWFSLVRRVFCECALSRYLDKLAGGIRKLYRPWGGPYWFTAWGEVVPAGEVVGAALEAELLFIVAKLLCISVT
jgi:hypothetical protein